MALIQTGGSMVEKPLSGQKTLRVDSGRLVGGSDQGEGSALGGIGRLLDGN